jgi:hypothetical protein
MIRNLILPSLTHTALVFCDEAAVIDIGVTAAESETLTRQLISRGHIRGELMPALSFGGRLDSN